MIGDTLTITLGGSGGAAHVLPWINQDAYSREYFLNDTDNIRYRAFIRHLKETVKNGAPPVDRHTVTFRLDFGDGSTENPIGFREASLILRGQPSDVPGYVSDVGEALAYWSTQANLLKVLGWES